MGGKGLGKWVVRRQVGGWFGGGRGGGWVGGRDALSCFEKKHHNSVFSKDICFFVELKILQSRLMVCKIGGWGGESNREIVSFRSCVRRRGLLAWSNWNTKEAPSRSLFPFGAPSFPVSLFGATSFPCSLPPPPSPYLSLVGFFGIDSIFKFFKN